MQSDDILWCLSWSAALTPDLPMIPNRNVFLCAPHGRSLTATVEGVPGLLLSFSASSLAGRLCGGVENAFTTSTNNFRKT